MRFWYKILELFRHVFFLPTLNTNLDTFRSTNKNSHVQLYIFSQEVRECSVEYLQHATSNFVIFMILVYNKNQYQTQSVWNIIFSFSFLFVCFCFLFFVLSYSLIKHIILRINKHTLVLHLTPFLSQIGHHQPYKTPIHTLP